MQIKTSDLLFFLPYGLFIAFAILSTSFYYKYFIGTPLSIINYSCVILLAFREFTTQKYRAKSLLIGLIFIVFALITRAQSSVVAVAYMLIFLFCARDVEFEKIAKFSLWLTLIVVTFIVISCYLKIIPNYGNSDLTRTRHYLGFRYALFGPTFIFNITGLFLYIKNEQTKWIEFIGLALLNYWFFIQTDSRLSFFLSILLIIVFAFLKKRPCFFERKRLLCYLMIASFAICGVLMLYITVTYNSSVPWLERLDTFLGRRLFLGQLSIFESGVSWFGQRLELVGSGLDAYGHKNMNPYNYVDSFYVQILQRYGIVFSIVWISILTITLYRCYKMKDYPMMVCLTSVAIHCTIDDLSMYLYYNTFWFAITLVMVNAYKLYKNYQNIRSGNQLENNGTLGIKPH